MTERDTWSASTQPGEAAPVTGDSTQNRPIYSLAQSTAGDRSQPRILGRESVD